MHILESLLSRNLRDIADKIDAGSCEMSDDEVMTALDSLVQFDRTQLMSKEESCFFLDMSRSAFDEKVRWGLLPRGEKIAGLKELVWHKADLLKYLELKKTELYT